MRRVSAAREDEDAIPPTLALEEEAVQAGRKYAIIGAPWLPKEPVAFFKTALDATYDKDMRHDSDSTKIQGCLHDIADMLPAHLREHMSTTWFAKKVRRLSPYPCRCAAS